MQLLLTTSLKLLCNGRGSQPCSWRAAFLYGSAPKLIKLTWTALDNRQVGLIWVATVCSKVDLLFQDELNSFPQISTDTPKSQHERSLFEIFA